MLQPQSTTVGNPLRLKQRYIDTVQTELSLQRLPYRVKDSNTLGRKTSF